MQGSYAVSDRFPRVPEFYNGKSVFLTGAVGFAGSAILEILLRCCPGIKSIFVLIRPKKNVDPVARKQELLKRKIFEKLAKENPELFGKVQVISGDVSLVNLDMSEDDTHLILEEVSIVFHCAAIIKWNKPLEFILKNNVLSLNTIIELCRKMKKFEVLVYTSTAYTNSNNLKLPSKEEIFRLPFPAKQFLDALKNEDNETLKKLASMCKPDWPNMYCFGKCLAENLIMDTASDLTVAIIRPSLIFSTFKDPIPGYFEYISGMGRITFNVLNGLIKIMYADPKSLINLVPNDIVAKTHVLAAWSVGTARCESPFVVNCTATESLQVALEVYFESAYKLSQEFPLPLSFTQPTYFKIVHNKYLYCFFLAFYHYLPAIVDQMIGIFGEETKLYDEYRNHDTLINAVSIFLTTTFKFERNNMECIEKLICPQDLKNFSIDFREADIRKMISLLPEGSPVYDWKLDKISQYERQRIKYKRCMQIRCIQGIFLIVCFLFIYWVFSSLLL